MLHGPIPGAAISELFALFEASNNLCGREAFLQTEAFDLCSDVGIVRFALWHRIFAV